MWQPVPIVVTLMKDITVCGEEMVRRLRIIQHDSRKKEDMVSLGKTSFGNEVAINKYVANADRVILTGAVTLHPFAGFGGGRKAVMPGVAAYDSIMKNHCMTMSPIEGVAAIRPVMPAFWMVIPFIRI